MHSLQAIVRTSRSPLTALNGQVKGGSTPATKWVPPSGLEGRLGCDPPSP